MDRILMPRVGLTQEEGTITEWMIGEGDSFSEGDVLAQMTSDKSTNDITAEFSGRIVKIIVAEDESCPVGAPIAEVERA